MSTTTLEKPVAITKSDKVKAKEGKAARECAMVDVWKLEEKESDVALALHAFSDAIRNEVDQIVAITNDTDFAPAMRLIRQHDMCFA